VIHTVIISLDKDLGTIWITTAVNCLWNCARHFP